MTLPWFTGRLLVAAAAGPLPPSQNRHLNGDLNLKFHPTAKFFRFCFPAQLVTLPALVMGSIKPLMLSFNPLLYLGLMCLHSFIVHFFKRALEIQFVPLSPLPCLIPLPPSSPPRPLPLSLTLSLTLSQEELQSGEEIARCPSCSLFITVIYNVVSPTLCCAVLIRAALHLSSTAHPCCTAPL